MIVVLDVGGTTTRIGLSKIGVSLERHRELPTPPGPDGLRKLARETGGLLGKNKAEAIVLGLPGTLTGRGKIFRMPNLPEWQGADPVADFRSLTSGPVLLANDAVLVGLGEAHAGAGIKRGIMAYVTVSTGVNGARIVNGRPDAVTWGFEIGHQIINWNSAESLEAATAGSHIQERYGRLPSSVDDPLLWKAETKALATGLHNLNMHWSPEVIVLGGSMMRDIPLEDLEDELSALPNPFPSRPELRPAALGQLGGLYGGLAYWRQHGR